MQKRVKNATLFKKGRSGRAFMHARDVAIYLQPCIACWCVFAEFNGQIKTEPLTLLATPPLDCC